MSYSPSYLEICNSDRGEKKASTQMEVFMNCLLHISTVIGNYRQKKKVLEDEMMLTVSPAV